MTLLLAVGSALGFITTLAGGQVLASIVCGASPHDPWVLAGVFVGTALIGFAACWSPGRRATRVDPFAVLRWE